MKRILYTQFSSPVGKFSIAEMDEKVIKISFGAADSCEFHGWLETKFPDARILEDTDGESAVLGNAKEQIIEFFETKRKTLDFPCEMTGTDFQKSIWEAIARIPWGETRSYGDLAREVENPQAARAVGGACNRNPLPIIIPCHRVVGADGSLVGFGGGIELKEKLLALEGRTEIRY